MENLFNWFCSLFGKKKEPQEHDRIIQWIKNDLSKAAPGSIFEYRVEIPLNRHGHSESVSFNKLEECLRKILAFTLKGKLDVRSKLMVEHNCQAYVHLFLLTDAEAVEAFESYAKGLVEQEAERFMERVGRGEGCSPTVLQMFYTSYVPDKGFVRMLIEGFKCVNILVDYQLPFDVPDILHSKMEGFKYSATPEYGFSNWYPFLALEVKLVIHEKPVLSLGRACKENAKKRLEAKTPLVEVVAENCIKQIINAILKDGESEVYLDCTEDLKGPCMQDLGTTVEARLDQFAEMNGLKIFRFGQRFSHVVKFLVTAKD